MESTKEIRISREDNKGRVIKVVKESLLENEKVRVVCGHNGAPETTKALDFLSNLGYLSISNIQTETKVNDRKLIGLVFEVTKSAKFQELFDEHEAAIKKRRAEQEEKDEQKK